MYIVYYSNEVKNIFLICLFSGMLQDNEFTPGDFSIISALGKPVKLSDEFKQNYDIWLEQEVFQNNIDWNALLTDLEN